MLSLEVAGVLSVCTCIPSLLCLPTAHTHKLHTTTHTAHTQTAAALAADPANEGLLAQQMELAQETKYAQEKR
jgi:hypothetical protein